MTPLQQLKSVHPRWKISLSLTNGKYTARRRYAKGMFKIKHSNWMVVLGNMLKVERQEGS